MTSLRLHRLVPVLNTRRLNVGWRCIWCPAEWAQLPPLADRYGCSRIDDPSAA